MNKQDEEKAISIADSCIGERTRNHPANQLEKIMILDACLEMAAWKEEQMVEKAVEWLEDEATKHIGFDCITEEMSLNYDFIELFIKAMKGE